MKVFNLILVVALLCLNSNAEAQEEDYFFGDNQRRPVDPPGTPIDGGLLLLLGAGAAYGINQRLKND